MRGWSNHRTPLAGLYLVGCGTHPGGGVMGAAVLGDMRIRLRGV
jgi:phytoene dehydrogenase-like protein